MTTQAGSSTYTLPADIKKLQLAAREYVQKHIVALEEDLDYDAIEIASEDRARLEKLAEQMGLRGREGEGTVRQELSAFGNAVFSEELVQHRAGLYVTCYGTLSGGAGGNRRFTDDQRKRFAGRRGFMAITEPSGGADPARAIKTYAVRDGDDWVLNGSKIFIGGMPWSDYGIVYARTDPNSRRGISCLIVEKGMPGFTWNPIPVTRTHYAGQAFFDNVRLPGSNLVGELHNAWKMMAYEGLAKGRVGYSVSNLGIAVGAHRLAVEDCKSRETFGAPLSTRQAVQWMLVDSEIEIKSNRWICWESAWQVDADEDFRFAASLAKVHSAEVLQRVLDRSMVIMGARALSKETSFDRWYREARIRRIGEGPSEVQRIVVSRDLLSVGSGVNPPTESVQ